mgnify:CR=1 FL=1
MKKLVFLTQTRYIVSSSCLKFKKKNVKHELDTLYRIVIKTFVFYINSIQYIELELDTLYQVDVKNKNFQCIELM